MYQGPTFPAPTSPLLQAPAKLRCLQTSVDLLIHQEGDQENYPSFLGKGHRMAQPLVFTLSPPRCCSAELGRRQKLIKCCLFYLYHLSSSSVSERYPLQETAPFWGALSVTRVCSLSLLPPLTENFLLSFVYSLSDLAKVRFSWQQEEAQTRPWKATIDLQGNDSIMQHMDVTLVIANGGYSSFLPSLGTNGISFPWDTTFGMIC